MPIRFRAKSAIAALCAMVILLGGCSKANDHSQEMDSNVLIHFDKQDRQRMNQFIERADEGKFDYVLAVISSFEGGKVIYDLISDQQDGKLHVTIDDTRDAYAGMNKGQKKYVCEDIGWAEAFGSEKVRLSGCDGAEAEGFLIGFGK
ncbi:DUF4362 domain-containing protein [Cohnella thailandensis]|uniref:DUF4362 domain-containing protein n=1 Tax=Cohnella thailandensis TaxID=557557 RepID=A0A841SX81_9BACL|nr:DUF4362 domain-containing protein [Cohnella thailandensis]MBB6634765.1 DUF4362 domain-containing protein [Cohnella thailandensis]MBP1977883.1 hypothetical protein [Cohnella thailandensis]